MILPAFIENTYWIGIKYSKKTSLDDIDKAICRTEGMSFENIITIKDSIEDAIKQGKDLCESTFFKPIRFYKKGTVHLYWKDNKVRERFNMAVAKTKKWIGYDTNK